MIINIRKLTSKSIIPLYANSKAAPKATNVSMFLGSLIDVKSGIDPICQS